ncbi:MAG: NADH:flavin oxidoreductase/NADH oxidase family protein [Pseudomonadota bacterium]
MPENLQDALILPCGATISNRIAKAAMTEGLADSDGAPTERLVNLYRVWGESGAGILLSGNIQIDKDHLERPGNVIIEGRADADKISAIKAWTAAATNKGAHFWAQISHAGRQTPIAINNNPKSPSDIGLKLPGNRFGAPSPLTIAEIEELTDRFAQTALLCKECGFTGVQLHAAHGYLLSAFLNPRANNRDDAYGGSLENRARFLLNVVERVREAVGSEFPISAKVNSADFQKGGFAFEDSTKVAGWLADAGVDLLEISGGNYEQPKLISIEGVDGEEVEVVAPSTAAREAYFVDFAQAMQDHVSAPLMVTGGFRTRGAMEYALNHGAAQMIGLARPFCYVPDAPKQLLSGAATLPSIEKELRLIPNWLSFLRQFQMLKLIDSFAVMFWFYAQIYELAERGEPNMKITPFRAMKIVENAEKAILAQRK